MNNLPDEETFDALTEAFFRETDGLVRIEMWGSGPLFAFAETDPVGAMMLESAASYIQMIETEPDPERRPNCLLCHVPFARDNPVGLIVSTRPMKRGSSAFVLSFVCHPCLHDGPDGPPLPDDEMMQRIVDATNEDLFGGAITKPFSFEHFHEEPGHG